MALAWICFKSRRLIPKFGFERVKIHESCHFPYQIQNFSQQWNGNRKNIKRTSTNHSIRSWSWNYWSPAKWIRRWRLRRPSGLQRRQHCGFGGRGSEYASSASSEMDGLFSFLLFLFLFFSISFSLLNERKLMGLEKSVRFWWQGCMVVDLQQHSSEKMNSSFSFLFVSFFSRKKKSQQEKG